MKKSKPLRIFSKSPTLSYVGLLLRVLLLLVIPFNIVYHFLSTYAYVDAFYVNYLDFAVHIVDLAVFAVCIYVIVFERAWESKRVRLGILMIAGFLLFHNLLFDDPVVLYSSTRLALYVLCFLLVVICGIGRCVKDQEERKKNRSITVGGLSTLEIVILAIALVAIVQVVIGFLQFFLNRTLGLSSFGESLVQVGGYSTSSVSLPDGMHLRAYGTFPHPNILGGYLTFVLIILLFSLNKIEGWKRYIVGGVILAVIVGVIVTWSRAAWFASAASVLVWGGAMFWKRGRRDFLLYVAGLLILLSILSVWVWFGQDLVSSSLRERFVVQLSSVDVSIRERNELANRAVDMIKDQPLAGFGVGNFINQLALDPVYSDNKIRVMQPVHNIPLLMLVEVGVLGVSCFIGFFVLIFRWPKLTVLLFVVLFSFMVLGSVDHYLWSLPKGLAVFLMVGLWYRVYRDHVL